MDGTTAPHELQGMAEATEIEPAVLQQMTLARFEYVGITLGRKPHLIDMGESVTTPADPATARTV